MTGNGYCVFEAVNLSAGMAVVGVSPVCSLAAVAERVGELGETGSAEYRWVECHVPRREDADAFARAYAKSEGLRALRVSYIA